MRFPIRIDEADEATWVAFRAWCDDQGVSANTALLLLMKAAVEGRVAIGAVRVVKRPA